MTASPSQGRGPEREIRLQPADTPADGFHLSLLGAFELSEGAIPIALPGQAQRLLAFLAIGDRVMTRSAVAGTLWPEATDEHAHASLRTLLSRFDETARSMMSVTLLDLTLKKTVSLDLRDSQALAHRLLIVGVDPTESDLSAATLQALSVELLPDWYDEWLSIDAAQWHRLRINALEALVDMLLEAGRPAMAEEAAELIVAAEPLSEGGYSALIRTHLARGERAKANETYDRYRDLIRNEMDVEPSAELARLLARPGAGLMSASSVMRLAQTAVAGEETRAFEVVAFGISMEPSIRHGDKLFVSQDVNLEAGRIVVAVHDDIWIVKRLALRDGSLVLRSDNANEEVSLGDVEIKGVVVELRRNM